MMLRNAMVLVVLASLASCSVGKITESRARRMAIQEYRRQYGDKTFFNPIDGKHHKYPPLQEGFFHQVAVKDGCWQLVGDPPAGVHVYASVALDGSWVKLTRVGFAPQ